MISARRIIANRANAQASTGPRTVHGKSRAAQNARRHGLSFSVMAQPALAEQVQTLAQQLAGPLTDAEVAALTRTIAEAQFDLDRIRRARHDLLMRNLGNVHGDLTAQLIRLDDYERRAFSRRSHSGVRSGERGIKWKGQPVGKQDSVPLPIGIKS